MFLKRVNMVPDGSTPGAILARLGAILALGKPWGLLGIIMGRVGAFLGCPLPIWSRLGYFWASLKAFWERPKFILGPSWSHPAIIREFLDDLKCFYGAVIWQISGQK